MDMFSSPLATSAALVFTRDGELTVVEGSPADPSTLGAQLLALLRPAPARPPRLDLAFGREVARRVLLSIAARGVAGEEELVTPGPGELGALLAAAPALIGRPLLDDQVLAAAWSAVAAAAREDAGLMHDDNAGLHRPCGSPGRAERGRAYVRAGALLDLKVRPGCITAQIDAAIRLRPIVSVAWPPGGDPGAA